MAASLLTTLFAATPSASAQSSCLQNASHRELLNEVSRRMNGGGSGGGGTSSRVRTVCQSSLLILSAVDDELNSSTLQYNLVVNSLCQEAAQQLEVFFKQNASSRSAVGALCKQAVLIEVGITSSGVLKEIRSTDLIVNSRCTEARNRILGLN